MESIHGHDVMALIAEAGRPLSRSEIVALTSQRFGAEARYHTCSAEGLSAEGLVDFLKERGKLTGGDGALSLDTGEVCQH
jgi:probable metal-binding protein